MITLTIVEDMHDYTVVPSLTVSDAYGSYTGCLQNKIRRDRSEVDYEALSVLLL